MQWQGNTDREKIILGLGPDLQADSSCKDPVSNTWVHVEEGPADR